MKPALKKTLWSLACVAITASVIAPKVIPRSRVETEAKPAVTSKPETARGERGGGNALAVATFVVKPEPFAEKLQATGTLRADEAVELQAETTGKIVSIEHYGESADYKTLFREYGFTAEAVAAAAEQVVDN